MESRSNSSTLHRRYSVGPDLILPKTSSFLPPYTVADTDTTPSSSSSSSSSYSPLLSFPSFDLELISLNSQSYTSLKDILPTTSLVVNSPTPTGPSSEIPIRNRLVKQAAWAYLQPMVASPTSSSRPISQLFDCGLIPVLTRAFHQLLIHFHIRPSSRFL